MSEIQHRCGWVNLANPLYVAYHDYEWGIPCHDDRMLFELLVLEGFQAGLSWESILNKREAFRAAFDGFDVRVVAGYGESKVAELMANPGIVRNRRKIEAAIANAQAFMRVQTEWGSFDSYLWAFVDGGPVIEDCSEHITSPLGDRVSADLKRRGFKFVGPVITYSYLQATGVICGHERGCDLSALG